MICKICGIDKETKDFYKHKNMTSGFLSKCKECCKKAVKENVLKNEEKYKDYHKKYRLLPSSIEARLQYEKKKEYKEVQKKSKEKWIINNQIKRAAHNIVQINLRNGKLIKPLSCENCNLNKKLHAHHDNYAFPLSVRWLCPKCHKKWHDENESING